MRAKPKAVAATASVLAAAIGVSCGTEAQPCSSFRFDRQEWRAEPLHRHQQADALVRCGTLEGKTRAEVRYLLGKPGPENVVGNEWVYSLGAERGLFVVDDENLGLEFNEQGRATNAEVYQG